MRGRLSSAERDFQAQARDFVDRHWPAALRRHHAPRDRGHPAVRRWREALVARGWSVPAWPVRHGGTGWSANEQVLWREETAAAGAPELDLAGTEVVGPLLCAMATPEQQQMHLPGIREARVTWCVALDEGVLALRRDGDPPALRLRGTLPALAGAAAASWSLCRAEGESAGGTLLLLDLTAAGVTVRPHEALDGTVEVATLEFTDVVVPSAAILGEPGMAARELDRLPALAGAFVPRSPALAVHVGQLRELAEVLGHDAPWQPRLAALEIELTGLHALERRALASTTDAAGLRQAAMLRRRELARQLTELGASLLGYYALPFPDARLIDNEGPIGHDYALTAVTGRLRAAAGRDDMEKNRLARWLAGP